MVQIIISPVLKWAGGKTQLLSIINQKYPEKLRQGEIKTYIEPFLGGGAVFFDIYSRNASHAQALPLYGSVPRDSRFSIKKAYLFDKNIELIILYKVIQNDVNSLINKLSNLQKEYLSLTPENRNIFYYQSRDIYNKFDKKIETNTYDKDWVERAAFTIFLNKTCFNGLYRVNSKGHFNVPMGRYKNPKILNEQNLRAVNQAFKIAEIQHKDFSEALKYADESTFIYYDPPYRPISKTASFNAYSSSDFDDNEQRRLKNVFLAASNKGALQMLSNSDPTNYVDDPFFDELYQGFNITRITALRMINSKGNSRGLIREILVFNY